MEGVEAFSETRDLIAAALLSVIFAAALFSLAWLIWRLIRNGVKKLALVASVIDACLVGYGSYVTGTRQKAKMFRWGQLIFVLFVLPIFIVLADGIISSPLATIALVANLIAPIVVYRHWSWDVEDKAHGLEGNYKRIKGWEDLRNEWLISALALFLMIPLVFYEADKSFHFMRIDGIRSPYGFVAFFWGEVLKTIFFFDYWEIYGHRLAPYAEKVLGLAKRDAGLEAVGVPYPEKLSAETATFALRVVLDLILLGGIFQLSRVFRGDLIAAKLVQADLDIESDSERKVESALRLLEGFALSENGRARRRLSEIARNALMPATICAVARSLGAIGIRRGDESALADAVAAAKRVGEKLDVEKSPAAWAQLQNDLGVSLRYLARYRNIAAISLLKEAIDTLNAATIIRAKIASPRDLAETKRNLGGARCDLARYSEENAISLLELAIADYEEARNIIDPKHNPVDWAKTLDSMGTAYYYLARARSFDASMSLELAIENYENALVMLKKWGAPDDRATTYNNLGIALCDLFSPDEPSSKALLHQAIYAFQASLTFRTRNRAPDAWAMTQYNLGNALRYLAPCQTRNEQIKLFQKSINCYEACLQVRSRVRTPLYFADTQFNLALSLSQVGTLLQNEQLLSRAKTAFDEAISLYEALGKFEAAEQVRSRM